MFESILGWLHSWMGNYGLAVIGFTILVRLVLSPFDYKSRVSMRKISKLQPKMAALQKKYANDKDKLNRKMSELYKAERVSPLSGCWPMLLSYPILILMFNAMRNYANAQMVVQVADMLQGKEPTLEGFLWIKNLYMADSPVVSRLVDLNAMRGASLDAWKNALSGVIQNVEGKHSITEVITWAGTLGDGELKTNLMKILTDAQANNGSWVQALLNNGDTNYIATVCNGILRTRTSFYANDVGVPGANLFLFGTIQQLYNGFWILPILSAASQFLMTKIAGGTQPQPAANDQQAQTQQATGKFMKWFFPIFSLWICASSTAAFALYWVASNLIAMVTTVGINKYLDNKEKKQAIAGEGIVQ